MQKNCIKKEMSEVSAKSTQILPNKSAISASRELGKKWQCEDDRFTVCQIKLTELSFPGHMNQRDETDKWIKADTQNGKVCLKSQSWIQSVKLKSS